MPLLATRGALSSRALGFGAQGLLAVHLLLAAGGGAGAGAVGGSTGQGGGGGAGGFSTSQTTIRRGESFAVVVGTGGITTSGTDTSFGALTVPGGGRGRGVDNNGDNGGSGGGAGLTTGGTTTGGLGTAPYGHNGGPGDTVSCGGGGGATSAGGTTTAGAGVSNSISGAAVIYCKGGTGGNAGANATLIGSGGDGNSGGSGGPFTGGSGSDGVVIASYASPTALATGGTITSYTSGGVVFQVHTFTANGTFAWL